MWFKALVFLSCFVILIGASSADTRVKSSWEDGECYFNKKQTQMGPRVLLETFLAADSRGEFVGNDKFSAFLNCPGHQGGTDAFEVISGYKILKEKVERDTAEFTVVFNLLGRCTSGGVKGELNSFIRDVKPDEFIFKMIKTPYGWRIDFGSTYGNKVLASHAEKFISHRRWLGRKLFSRKPSPENNKLNFAGETGQKETVFKRK